MKPGATIKTTYCVLTYRDASQGDNPHARMPDRGQVARRLFCVRSSNAGPLYDFGCCFMNSWTTTFPDGRPFQVVEDTPCEKFARCPSFRVFLSYRGGQEKDAIHLAARIEAFGITTFVAPRDLRPCDDWELEIERAIASCDALVAHCPPDFGEGDWTNKEVNRAGRLGKPVFPIWIGVPPTGPVTKYHAMQLNGDDVPVLEIVNRFTAFPRMTEALVFAIERCAQHGNFLLANQLARCFENVQHMSDEQAYRLIRAHNRKTITNRYGNTNQIRAATNFRPSYASPGQSVLTEKINELTGLSVSHGPNGDICDSPPTSVVAPQRAAAKPAFTREISRDSYAEDRYMSAVSRTQSERKVSSPVSPR